MYNVVQVGRKFIIRRADRKIEGLIPHQPSPILRIVEWFWTGNGWSTDRAEAKEFNSLVEAAICHPPD